MGKLKISLEELNRHPQEVIDLNWSGLLEPMEAGGDLVHFPLPVEARFSATWDGRVLRVHGKVRGQVEMTCACCLEKFKMPFDAPYEEVFQSAGDGEEGAHVVEGRNLDLTETIRLSVLLELPMRAICKTDCLGLCQQCGANLNLAPCQCRPGIGDPRLAALHALLNRKNEDIPGREG